MVCEEASSPHKVSLQDWRSTDPTHTAHIAAHTSYQETMEHLHCEAWKQQVEAFLSFMRVLKHNKIPFKVGCSAFLALL